MRGVLHQITRRRRGTGLALIAFCALALSSAMTTAAGAETLPGWGSSLSSTPTLDTANGDYSTNGSTHGPQDAITPNPHDGQDLGIWNTSSSGGATAPQDGQVLQVKIEGCAVKEPAPSQESLGTPVNTIEFQALKPSGSDWSPINTAGTFLLPFCGDTDSSGAQVSTTTASTYAPLHMCIDRGDAVALHDIGGFINDSATGGGIYYTQGIPLEVISKLSGSRIDSYDGISSSGSYGSTDPPTADAGTTAGFGQENGEEVDMQIIEGVGDDAYAACPGGHATEPADSNTITCVADNTPEPGKTPCPGYAQGTTPSSNTTPGKTTPTHGQTAPSKTSPTQTPPTSAGSSEPTSSGLSEPLITKLKVRPTRFTHRTIAHLTWVDDQAGALATIRTYRLERGIKRGGRCVKVPKHTRRNAIICKARQVLIKTQTHHDAADVVTGKNLPRLRVPGRYVVKVSARKNGTTGNVADVDLTVIR